MFSDTSLKEALDMERFANNIASFFWSYWSYCHAKLYFYGTVQQQSALNIFGLLILFFIASSINVSAVNASINIEIYEFLPERQSDWYVNLCQFCQPRRFDPISDLMGCDTEPIGILSDSWGWVWVRVSKEANRYRVSTLLKGLIRQLNYMLILF